MENGQLQDHPLPERMMGKAKLWHCTVCQPSSREETSATLAGLVASSLGCYLCLFLLDIVAAFRPKTVQDPKLYDTEADISVTWKRNVLMPGDLEYYPVKLECPSLLLRLEIFDPPCK